MTTARRVAAGLCLAAGFSVFTTPTGSAQGLRAADSASVSTTKTNDVDPAPLGPEQVKAQLEKAKALQAQLSAANAGLASAGAKLAQLSAASQTLMSKLADARAAEAAARAEEQAATDQLKKLSSLATKAHTDVQHMAYDAYVNGSGSLADVSAVIDLVTRDGAGTNSAAVVDYLSQNRHGEAVRYTSLAQLQQKAAAKAVAARQARSNATAAAEAAKKAADEAVAAQQVAVLKYQEQVTAASSGLSAVDKSVTGGTGVTLKDLSALVTTPLCTDDTRDYPNGRIPGAALCPIDGAPGHMMRPAAARAMNAMKAAFAKDMHKPLCITDTYRSYEAQVDVRRRKPTLAAVPGTSNHGLGLATDLCGGIEDFGTPEHLWMQRNAPLFGFFHPAWAEPNGSKPEPWHWEYLH